MKHQQTRITPAALAAAAAGDMQNAMVAATPGGIEAQEAAGQAMLVAIEQLPKDLGVSREQLEAIGFVFGADVDDLFVTARLPPGWSKRASDHSMHSDLVDDKGRVRANIFYKAAFYDRRAHLSFDRRFRIESFDDGSSPEKYSVTVKDAGTPLKSFGEYDRGNYDAARPIVKEAEAWLDATYPERADPLAYWD